MYIKYKILSSAILLILLMTTACTAIKSDKITDIQEISIIPLPQKVIVNKGNFRIIPSTTIRAATQDSEIEYVVNYLANRIEKAAGFRISENSTSKENVIVFTIDESIQNKEGYHLSVDSKQIQISASQPSGLFYGVQSLLQLLPPEIYSTKVQKDIEWTTPAVEIEDAPRFSYRGLHLDVGRHFFNASEVKKFIDALARNI